MLKLSAMSKLRGGLRSIDGGSLATLVGLVALLALGSVASGEDNKVQVMMKDQKGQNVGIVHIEDTANGVLLHGEFNGVPEGTHAFHIHEAGKCDPPFETAGGHLHDGATKHGFANPEGFHLGDLPNINVPASGKVSFEAFASKVHLKGQGTALLDGDGAALVLHAKADDYRTDPAGNAGDRIACGVVRAVDNVSTRDIEPANLGR